MVTELTADQYFNIATKALKQFDFESIVCFDWNCQFNAIWLYQQVFGEYEASKALTLPIEQRTTILGNAWRTYKETKF